jgi:hypothetical protein
MTKITGLIAPHTILLEAKKRARRIGLSDLSDLRLNPVFGDLILVGQPGRYADPDVREISVIVIE